MVDILMATYNGDKYVRKQINSILNQTYRDINLIIHDDGSNDDTVKIVRELANKNPDKIRFVEDGVKTGGAKNNFFHLLQFSESEYIMFADQDDVWGKNKVKKAVACIKQKASLKKDIPLLGYSDLIVVDAGLKVINKSFFDMQNLDAQRNKFNNLLVQNNVTGCTVIFNRKLKEMCNEMPSEAIMHDWWMAIIASAFGEVFFMEHKEILYRQHGNNTEGAKDFKNPLYLLNKFFNSKQLKSSIVLTYNQAEEFKAIFWNQLSDEYKTILDAYIRLKYDNKFSKIKNINKYGFEKTGIIRQIVQKILI